MTAPATTIPPEILARTAEALQRFRDGLMQAEENRHAVAWGRMQGELETLLLKRFGAHGMAKEDITYRRVVDFTAIAEVWGCTWWALQRGGFVGPQLVVAVPLEHDRWRVAFLDTTEVTAMEPMARLGSVLKDERSTTLPVWQGTVERLVLESAINNKLLAR